MSRFQPIFVVPEAFVLPDSNTVCVRNQNNNIVCLQGGPLPLEVITGADGLNLIKGSFGAFLTA
jgi:hypothetical protein